MHGDDTTIPNWDSDDTTIPSEDTTQLRQKHVPNQTDITVGEFNKMVRAQSYEVSVQRHGFDEILQMLGWDAAEASVRSVYAQSDDGKYNINMTNGVLEYLREIHLGD